MSYLGVVVEIIATLCYKTNYQQTVLGISVITSPITSQLLLVLIHLQLMQTRSRLCSIMMVLTDYSLRCSTAPISGSKRCHTDMTVALYWQDRSLGIVHSLQETPAVGKVQPKQASCAPTVHHLLRQEIVLVCTIP